MFILQKISVQSGAKIFKPKHQKFLRIQHQDTVVKTQSPARVISQSSLQWAEVIQLPQVFDVQMPFEIFEKHQFGYNPEEIDTVLHGKISFSKGDEKYHNWEIFDSNDRKIGYLSVDIRTSKHHQNPGSSIASSYSPKKIQTMKANIPNMKAKRAYAVLTIGDTHKTTQISKSKSGELVFVERYELEKPDDVDEGLIEIVSVENVTAPDGSGIKNEKKIAEAIVKLSSRIDRKIILCDEEGNQIGEGFIDGKVQMKSDVLAKKMLTGMIKRSFIKEKASDLTNPYKDLSQSILSQQQLMKSRNANHTSLDMSRSRTSRVSVVNGNTNIRFPQEKRFAEKPNSMNNKCSYLTERNFDLKEKRVDKYYRGASIGYGNKKDFTSERSNNPGVGKYKLPSIWDRY